MNQSDISVRSQDCYSLIAWRVILTPAERKAVAASCGVLILPTMLLNYAVCIALYKTKQLKSISKLLIFVLSASDFVTGCFTIPASVILFTVFGTRRCCWLEMATVLVGQSNGQFANCIILVLALQRYMKARPNSRSSNALTRMLSNPGLRYTIMACGVFSLLHGLSTVFFLGFVSSSIPNIILMNVRILIMVVIYVCYFRLYFSIKKHVHNISHWQNSRSTEISQTPASTKTEDSYSSFFKTVYIILVVFAICFLPILIFDLWTGIYTHFKKAPAPHLARFLYFLSHAPFFMNSSFNAAVFLYRDGLAWDFVKTKFNEIDCLEKFRSRSVDVNET